MNKFTKILIYITVFLIPTYLIKFGIFGIPTNVLEILIYLAFISWIFEKQKVNWKKLFQEYKIYIVSILLIFLGLMLSTLINKNYQVGFGVIRGWFFDPLLFSFVLIQKIKEQKNIENILKILYFSAFTVSLIALEYFFYGNLSYDGRLSAFWSSPNYLAMFLAPAIFIGIHLLKSNKQEPKNKNVIMIFSLIIIAFIIYLTHSYSVWASIVLGLLIAELITKRINKKFITISFLIILFAFLTQFGNPKLKDIFSERSSLSSRIMIWKSSALMLKNNFIFGIGPGNFQNKYLEYQKYFPPYLEWAVPEPHNIYLAFWLQSGIIGFTGFIILIFSWLKKITKEILNNQKNSHILAVSLGIMTYILIHGIFDTTYWKNDLSLVFWIIFSMALLIQDRVKLAERIPNC